MRARCARADVARDLADLLVRDIEAIVPLESEEEVVPGNSGNGLRLEAEQLPDPVVLVDHVVAGPQVRKALERAAEPGVGARRTLAEDLRVGQKTSPRSRETNPRRARETVKTRPGSAGSGSPSSRSSGSTRRSSAFVLRASPRWANVTTTRFPPRTNRRGALGFGEAARGNRRALRLEGVRLPRRKLAQVDHPLERNAVDELLLPGLANLVRLPHQIGWSQRRDKVVRNLGLVPGAELRVGKVQPPFGGRVDRRLLEHAKGPLCEGREGADRLHLVPEELDSNWLASRGREHVDDAATHSELAALLDTLDALVPGEGELGDQLLGARLGADLDVHGLRARAGRGKQVGHPECRGADETSSCEDLERTRSLAHEVRRWPETRLPPDAARG